MRKASKKVGGRPVGSPNVKYAAAIRIPPSCPRCGSIHIVAVPGAKAIERAIAGKLPGGFQYVSIRWQRSKCKECGQAVTVRTYIPERINPAESIATGGGVAEDDGD